MAEIIHWPGHSGSFQNGSGEAGTGDTEYLESPAIGFAERMRVGRREGEDSEQRLGGGSGLPRQWVVSFPRRGGEDPTWHRRGGGWGETHPEFSLGPGGSGGAASQLRAMWPV